MECIKKDFAQYRVPLFTMEMLEKSIDSLFPSPEKWLVIHLEIPTNDPLFTWRTIPGEETSRPFYYGRIPEDYTLNIYPLSNSKLGKFTLPQKFLNKQKKSLLLPEMLVNKFLRYQNWQNKNHLYKLQTNNFAQPKVRLQWWYFDFFLQDSSTVVLAFIPQYWWEEGQEKEKRSLLFLTHRTKEGTVKKFSQFFPSSEILSYPDSLVISSKLMIASHGTGASRTYMLHLNFPQLDAEIKILPGQPPFAPFPTGVMPGFLQTLINGAPKGSPDFSYVAQVPDAPCSGFMNWDGACSDLTGKAYHEQGRLDDSPEKQGSCWSWYHFRCEGWNIFGSPGTLIYVQKDDQVIRSGFQMVPSEYLLKERAFTSTEHPKMLTGGKIIFKNKELEFVIKFSPFTARPLVCSTSSDPNQLWATADGPAEITIVEGTKKSVMKGLMLLETCSWGKIKIP